MSNLLYRVYNNTNKYYEVDESKYLKENPEYLINEKGEILQEYKGFYEPPCTEWIVEYGLNIKTKNHDKLFVGDILNGMFDNANRIVEFDPIRGFYLRYQSEYHSIVTNLFDIKDDIKYFTIVGNIHDE